MRRLIRSGRVGRELLLLALLALLAALLHVLYNAIWMLVLLWLAALFAQPG